jgi:hypothetical protein
MNRDFIIKEADFATDFLKGVKDSVDFKNRPFETVFDVLGTGILLKYSWVVGGLSIVASTLGYGPGYIGRLIDDYFRSQGAKGVDQMDLSMSSAKGAADFVSNAFSGMLSKLKSGLGIEASLIVRDIGRIKGYTTYRDVEASLYVASSAIVKEGRVKHFTRLLSQWRRGRKLHIISGALMGLIWLFMKGMIALGIGKGIAYSVGLRTKKVPVEEKGGLFRPDSSAYPAGKVPGLLQYYSNVGGDVKNTLIKFIDATIANFSNGFIQAQRLANPNKVPVAVERVPAWNSILRDVEAYNWAKLSEVNKFSSFVAPPVMIIARRLLQSAGITGAKIEKIKSTLKPKTPTKELLPS